MRAPVIVSSNLEHEFQRIRQRPHNNVIMDSDSLPGNIPPHILQAMRRRAQAGDIGVAIDRVGQFRYNPFLQSMNLDIPSDLKIRHQYMRFFVRTDPLVGASIELHSEFPLSGFHIEHEDPAIEEFLEDMIEETDLFEHVLQCAMEWWTIGEFFSFGFLDDIKAPSCWSGFLLLDPDKLLVQTSPWVRGVKKEKVALVIDNLTQKIVEQGPTHPVSGAIFRELPPDIVLAARARRPLELSPLQVAHVKRGSPFSIRGESVIERVFTQLMYKSKLRAAQYVLCDRHITPTELWKIGETGDPADNEELENFRQMISSTFNDINRCFHPSHECLTKEGWKHYTALTLNDEVGTLNKETHQLEFQRPTHIHQFDHDGPLVKFIGTDHDILVTTDHRMLKTLECPGFVTYVDGALSFPSKHVFGYWRACELKPQDTNGQVEQVSYKGPVWCVTVPNGTVITRRNGKATVQGNCVISHHAVQYQIEGATGKIMPIWQEMEGIDNEICAGLLLNKSLIMGDSSSFASDVVRYDILVNRYLIFRKKIEKWLLRSIMAPILKIHEMYVPEFKVKSMQYRQMSGKGRPLSFPTIKWEKQNLRDDQARTQLLIDLAAKGLVPYSTIYPLLSLDPRQVNERIDKEIEETMVRRKKLSDKLAAKGIQLPPDMFGGKEGGGMPLEVGGGDLPSAAIGGPGGGLPGGAEGMLPGGPGGGLPIAVPGTEEGATAGVAGGLPGAPSESHLPIGVPTG